MDNTEQNQNQKNESKNFKPFVFLFLALVALDQAAKVLARQVFKNRAFAFSLPLPPVVMYLIYAAALLGIIYYILKTHLKFSARDSVAWTLILAGALCNVFERIALGYVRDFIYITFSRWVGVYNFADFYIIIGIVLLLLPRGKKETIIQS